MARDGELAQRSTGSTTITPEAYGTVQISLETAFGDGMLWWDGEQPQVVPEDPKTATRQFQKRVAAAARPSNRVLIFDP